MSSIVWNDIEKFANVCMLNFWTVCFRIEILNTQLFRRME